MKTAPLDSQTLQGEAAALKSEDTGRVLDTKSQAKRHCHYWRSCYSKSASDQPSRLFTPSPGAHKSQNSTEVWLQQKEMMEGSREPVGEQGSLVSRSGLCCGRTSLSPQQPMLTHACYCFLGRTPVVDLHLLPSHSHSILRIS